jgi:hypothetical protein
MHSHDLDLIAAYAEGSAGDDTEARALVESCADCRAEYEAQRRALSFLGALPAASPMTDIEKAALHRDLWTALRNPAPVATGTPRWMRWSLAAAGVFVVVGVAGVLGQMGGDDASEQDVVAFAENTTTGGDAYVRGSAEEPLAPAAEGGSVTTAAEDQGEEAFSTTTAGAAAETTIATALTDADFEAAAADARAAEISDDTTTTTAPGDGEAAARCAQDDRLAGQEVLATVELDRTYLLMVPGDVQLTAETPITFVDAATCDVVHVVE